MTTNDMQVLRAAEGDFATAEWPIGGVCKLESRDGDWALVTQWGTAYLLKRQGLVQMIDACEAALDGDLGLPSVKDELDALRTAIDEEVKTRQGCAGNLGGRLDEVVKRLDLIEKALAPALVLD